MSDFTRMSGYNKDTNFTQVRFGSDAPLLEVELNELQQIQNEARADLVRHEIPSGFLSMASLDFDYMKTHPNTIKTKTENIVNVDGYRVLIPAGTEFKLGDCPTKGRRSDLVLLECWFEEIDFSEKIEKLGKEGGEVVQNYLQDPRVGIETSRRVQLKHRIRIVEGVNFNATPEGMSGLKARGANQVDTELEYKISANDKGLYIAGEGNDPSKSLLRTVNGYSYALPMYQVVRRNTGVYSAQNGNGGNNYIDESSKCSRPDELFANIVYDRDIVDLRHLVSPVGFNYQKLLNENFDKFMRGELQTVNRLTIDKTYLGVLKTPMDEFIQFYASFDGTIVAEVGGTPTKAKDMPSMFLPSPVGLGIVGTNHVADKQILTWTRPYTMMDYITVDFFIQKTYYAETEGKSIDLIKLTDTNAGRSIIDLKIEDDALLIYCQNTQKNNIASSEMIPAMILNKKRPVHCRVVYDYIAKVLRYYVNGIYIKQIEGVNLELNAITNYSVGVGAYGYILSDFNISSVARNSDFKTLPTDFIEGYDSVAPAFNGQRRVYSEAITYQNAIGLAYAVGAGHTLGVSATQKTAGQWAEGDTIIVKGMANEIITGVIDSDTVLARLTTRVNNSPVIKVDLANELAVKDKVKFYNTATGVMLSGEFTITELDKVSKIVTLDNPINIGNDFMYYVLVEITTESSSPVAKYLNAQGTPTTVVGTWTGMGTEEVLFTLGQNADLTMKDIQIDYGLIIPAGQGITNEILSKTLCGEMKGRKLKIGTVAVMDDFAGKVKSQFGENPNSAFICSGANPIEPSSVSWVEDEQSGYISYMVGGDSNSKQVNSGATGERAQMKFIFNILKMVEAKYGNLKVIDKITWLRQYVDKINVTWTGYGVSGAGNKVYFSARNIANNSWDSTTGKFHDKASASPIELNLDTQQFFIDNTGCITLIAYTDKADDKAVASLFTDYIKCEVEFDYYSGYDVLVPDNPRRDAGQCGVILVRKETKEIMTYFDSTKEDGLIVYGEFIPVYPTMETEEEMTILAECDGFLVSDLATSVGHKQGVHHYPNPLYRVRNDIVDLFGEFGFGYVPFASDSRGVNIGAKVKFNRFGAVDYFTRQYGIPVIDKPMVGIAYYLVYHNGELKMLVFSKYTNCGLLEIDNKGICMLIPIEHRPLVREIEGVKRVGTIPTAWRTPTGAVEGYLNEDGHLVATYQ